MTELKHSRSVGAWAVVVAIVMVVMGILGGYVGYSFPDHPFIGKNRGVFVFLILGYCFLKIIEKMIISRKNK